MTKQLVFDTSDATSISHSDSVGAYLRSSDGTLITHTTVGGKEALDVRIAEGINVEVDLSHADDSVRLGDGTDLVTVTNVGADYGLDVNLINASVAVTATQLDIDDLNATDDAVAAYLKDGSGTSITSTGGALDVNIASGSVTINDAGIANTAIATAAATLAVADTAQDIIASPLSNRKYLYIRNMSNKDVYIGATGVTASNGFPLSPGMIIDLRCGAAVDVEFVGVSGATPTIRTMELS